MLQCLQLVVVLPLEVGQDGDPVIELEGVGVGSIVDQDHILHGPVQYPQVLNEVTFLGDEAVLPVKAVLDELPLWVQVVQDLVGIAGVACSEDHDFVPVLQALQQLDRARPNINACLRLLACRELNRDLQIVLQLHALIAVDERLVQVEYHSLLALQPRSPLQLQNLRFNLLFRRHF